MVHVSSVWRVFLFRNKRAHVVTRGLRKYRSVVDWTSRNFPDVGQVNAMFPSHDLVVAYLGMCKRFDRVVTHMLRSDVEVMYGLIDKVRSIEQDLKTVVS